ncbi:APH(3'') family aminoglycoside O-phosphotransferase [Streptomyces albofaciens JCM 4342]|uniref:APH(3'') family aminoglycoside O-phosphotransferase n=1 Tax=Streptomyces albofaciens TaxID=66866 RepID=UPI00123B54DB|nr:APH(3'') family aminoglycoside O-phosphotransferase [Streptomyces albofaciens]KAA6224529.1 APH(3'') family aminoglycoside O-phosphotransferase [Streptomyces albofaciens JCM 4342]
MSAFRALLRADGERAGWQPVTGGESGAAVFRSADGSRYAKCVPAGQAAALEAERDRVSWLAAQGIPGPRVLDWRVGAAGAGLVTSAVEGIPADRASASTLRTAWEAIADAVRQLHELPPEHCPFTRGLGEMVSMARDVVARGAVDPDFLPEAQRHTPPEELLARLTPQIGRRLAQESAQTVVCHGDLCLPNIILDPDTPAVAGFIDLGRLGRADPYADLALLFATARETWGDDERRSVAAEEEFAARYGIALDRDRERFYLHLDPLTWG